MVEWHYSNIDSDLEDRDDVDSSIDRDSEKRDPIVGNTQGNDHDELTVGGFVLVKVATETSSKKSNFLNDKFVGQIRKIALDDGDDDVELLISFLKPSNKVLSKEIIIIFNHVFYARQK